MIGGWRRIVIEQLEQRNLDDTYKWMARNCPALFQVDWLRMLVASGNGVTI